MIHIIDNFHIDADDRQYVLIEWDGSYDKKTGKNKQNVDYWYCKDIPSVFNALLRLMIRRGISKTDADGIIHIKRIVEEKTQRALDLFANFDATSIE